MHCLYPIIKAKELLSMEEKIPVQVKVCMLTWLENLEKSGVSKKLY